MATQNPYNVFRNRGVPYAPITALPANYSFDLSMDTWWSAVLRAREFSDFTGLDALYSYVMKSSTIVRSAVEKRLRPLKARKFGVYINGVEDERLTQLINMSNIFQELVYQKGLANFTFARVLGINSDGSTYIYPLRNLDVVNKRVKRQTYDVKGYWEVDNHANLFWLQTEYDSEDTLGLLEPISRDYINMSNARNNWQTASQFSAYQQLILYYENGDEEMQKIGNDMALSLGLGKVMTSGKTTDEYTGKTNYDYELQSVNPGAAADTFRIYKENIEQLTNSIMQLTIGSSLLGMSDKNTNSERLVRAHLKMFRDITEDDARDARNYLNNNIVKTKLAYLLNEPLLATCTFQEKPQDYIDIGDLDTYIKMFKDLQLTPTGSFIEKTGLQVEDANGYEEPNGPDERSEDVSIVREDTNASRGFAKVAIERARRFFSTKRPTDGQEVVGQTRNDS